MATFKIVQETEGSWTGPETAIVRGVNIPKARLDQSFREEDLDDFQTRKDDVFVVSYPKSGSTWMRELLWQIYNDGSISDENIGSRVFWFENHPIQHRGEPDTSESSPDSKPVIELLPSPRLLSSHLPYDVIPKGKDDTTTCKYIYIARNPKDVAVSHYHFLLFFPEMGEFTYDLCVKLFLQGRLFYNLWSDHVLGWWKHRNDPNVLFLKYEDLKKDLFSSVQTVADFLNKPLSKEVMQRIAHQCSFEEMAKHPDTYKVFPKLELSFLRKGDVGDWKTHFKPEMSEKFETELLAKVREQGLEFD